MINKQISNTSKLGARDVSIFLQNAMAHATAIHIHNAKLTDSPVELADIITDAKKIAREIFITATKVE